MKFTPRHALAFTGLTAAMVLGVAPAAFATNRPHVQDYIDGPCKAHRVAVFVADNSGNEKPETYTISDGTPLFTQEAPAHGGFHSPEFSIPASGATYTINAGENRWTFVALPDSECPATPPTSTPSPTASAPTSAPTPGVTPGTEPTHPATTQPGPSSPPSESTPNPSTPVTPGPSATTPSEPTPTATAHPGGPMTTPSSPSGTPGPGSVMSPPAGSLSPSLVASPGPHDKSGSTPTTSSKASQTPSADALAYTGVDEAKTVARIVFALWLIACGVLAVLLRKKKA